MADVPVPPAPPQQGFSMLTAGGLVLAIGGLYFGRDIFVPFALAVLLAFALSPLVTGLRKLKIPRIPAVVAVVAFALVVIATIGFVVGSQLVSLADNLPRYQYTVERKLEAVREGAGGSGILERLSTSLSDLGRGLKRADDQAAKAAEGAAGDAEREPDPIPVRVEPPSASPIEVIQTYVGPMVAPLATAGMVVVFLVFVLLEREDLRDRFIRLIGAGDLQKSTQALDDAGSRVSRYLLMQLVVNITYGIPIGVGLFVIGVPNAVLWGLMAAVLRFIPYLGPFLAAIFPLALAFAVDPGWSMLLWVIGLFLVVELISNNAVEPWLYGASTGLSSLAIIMAAVFWTTLWGPVGLFLATPLTVCLVAIGRYVPQLEFLGVLLGADPVLAPEQRLYQRLLAGNLEEAVELAEAHVTADGARSFFDQVAVPALRMAENDGQRSTSDAGYRHMVADTAICVVRDVADHHRDQARADGEPPPPEPGSGPDAPPPVVLCIAGRSELDRAAAEMLAELLRQSRVRVRALPPIMVTTDALGQLDLTGIDAVCITYLHPDPKVYARYVCRKLKRKAPTLRVCVAALNADDDAPERGLRTDVIAADAIASTLGVAHDRVLDWLSRSPPAEAVPPAADDPERARVLESLDLRAGQSERFTGVTREVAEAFGVPIALVALAEQMPDPADGDGRRRGRVAGVSSELASLGHLVAQDRTEVIPDIAKDARFADDSILAGNGIRFYAGAPMRLSNGLVIGTLCVIDTRTRAFPPEAVTRLEAFSATLTADIERDLPPGTVLPRPRTADAAAAAATEEPEPKSALATLIAAATATAPT